MSMHDLLAATTMKAIQALPHDKALHGIITGAWIAKDMPDAGTVQAIDGTTLALHDDPDSPDQPGSALKHRCILLSPGIGIQAGPQGGERCILIPLEDNGYGCLMVQGQDDAIGVPAGEIWIQRDDPTNTPPTTQKQFLKIQTDGATRIGAAAKIALLCSVVNLGAESLQADDGVVRKADLQKAINDVLKEMNQMFSSLARTVQPGSGVPPPQSQNIEVEASTTVYAAESNS
jgi:hypothetical protein